jgi:hypothetical protein
VVVSKHSSRSQAPPTVRMIRATEKLLGIPAINLYDTHAPLIAEPETQPSVMVPTTKDPKRERYADKLLTEFELRQERANCKSG